MANNKGNKPLNKTEIEKLYMKVLGHTTCKHGVYVVKNHCEPCSLESQKEMEEACKNFLKK